MIIFDKLLNFLLPPKCFGCNSNILTHHALCHNCWQKLEFITNRCFICGAQINLHQQVVSTFVSTIDHLSPQSQINPFNQTNQFSPTNQLSYNQSQSNNNQFNHQFNHQLSNLNNFNNQWYNTSYGCHRCITYTIKYNVKRYYSRIISPLYYNDMSRDLIFKLKYHGISSLKNLFVKLILCVAKDILEQSDVITAVPLHNDRLRQRGYNQSGLIATKLAKIVNKPCNLNLLIRKKNVISQSMLSDFERIDNVKGIFSLKTTTNIMAINIKNINDINVNDIETKDINVNDIKTKDVKNAIQIKDTKLHIKSDKTKYNAINDVVDVVDVVNFSRLQKLKTLNTKIHNAKIPNTKIQNKIITLIDDVVTTGATINECAKTLIENGEAEKVFVVSVART